MLASSTGNEFLFTQGLFSDRFRLITTDFIRELETRLYEELVCIVKLSYVFTPSNLV